MRTETAYRAALASALRDLRGIATPNLTMRERNRTIRAWARRVAETIREHHIAGARSALTTPA